MPANLIIDTDLSSDCGDAGALAIAHHAADLGDCAILAVVVNSTNAAAPACADAINYYYGRSIPLGRNLGAPQNGGSAFAGPIAARYPTNSRSAGEAVAVLRQALHDAADASVAYLTIGSLTNMAGLLASPGDGIDARDGAALVAAKVAGVVCMGGEYPGPAAPEFNFAVDPPATAAVLAGWPTPITFVGYEVGGPVTSGAGLPATSRHNPVKLAYTLMGAAAGHQSWDLDAAHYAIYGAQGRFAEVSGTNTANSSTGANTFAAGAGTHKYLVKTASDATLGALYDSFIDAPSSIDWPDPDVVPGPLLYLRFDDTSGTTAADSSGRGHPATLSGGAAFALPGKVGAAALDLSAASDARATVADHADLRFGMADDFTAACWVRTPASFSGGFAEVWAKSRNAPPWYALYLYPGGANWQFGSSADNAVYTGTAGSIAPSPATWHHVALVQRDGNRELWVDAVLDATGPGTLGDGTGDLTVGGNGGAPFAGRVDELLILNHALDAAGIAALRAGAYPVFGANRASIRSYPRGATRGIERGIA